MSVLLLALAGMICWGVAPVFVKLGLSSINPMSGLLVRTIFTASVLVVFMAADGSLGQMKSISGGAWLLLCIEALLATLCGDLAYFTAIKKGSVSLVTIIMSSSPLITVLCAVLFLGEQITLSRIVGAVLIIIGIILAV